MPELKKPDDFIIEDATTRALMTFLLGKWGDEQATLLIEWLSGFLDTIIDAGDAQLLYKYNTHREGHITDMSEARRRRQIEAFAIFQSILGDTIKAHIFTALSEATVQASKTLTQGTEKSIKAKETKRKREIVQLFDEAESAVLGVEKPWHRPEKYKKDSVERRSIEIMQAIGAGKRDKGKVALAYYGDFDLSKPGEKKRLFQTYNKMEKRDRDKCRSKYHSLLKSKKGQLTYEYLLERAWDEGAPKAHTTMPFGKALYERLSDEAKKAKEKSRGKKKRQ